MTGTHTLDIGALGRTTFMITGLELNILRWVQKHIEDGQRMDANERQDLANAVEHIVLACEKRGPPPETK
jgi:hypothetical protein